MQRDKSLWADAGYRPVFPAPPVCWRLLLTSPSRRGRPGRSERRSENLNRRLLKHRRRCSGAGKSTSGSTWVRRTISKRYSVLVPGKTAGKEKARCPVGLACFCFGHGYAVRRVRKSATTAPNISGWSRSSSRKPACSSHSGVPLITEVAAREHAWHLSSLGRLGT